MSGSGGDGDDLDEVTLWAGRLRAWPAAPASDADGDETVRSPRRASPAGDPTREVDAEGDETVRSPRLESHRGDATRGGRVDFEAPPDDDTAPRRAGRSRAVDGDSADSAAAVTAPDPAAPDPATPDPAVPDPAVPDPAVEATVDEATVDDATVDNATVDDATATAGRRPHLASDPVVEATGSGRGREAHAPTALQRETYAPRREAPVRVTRRAAAPAPGGRDAATVSPRRSRARARLLVLAAAIVGVVALAAVGVALLLA